MPLQLSEDLKSQECVRGRGDRHRLGCTGRMYRFRIAKRPTSLFGIPATSSPGITTLSSPLSLLLPTPPMPASRHTDGSANDNSTQSVSCLRPRGRSPAVRVDDEEKEGLYRYLGRRVSSCRLRASIEHDLGSTTSHLVSFASLSEGSTRRGDPVAASA